MPLVSVIMPFLNLKPFLQEAIESVVAQTHDCWELLLIDDGSTDGSSEIALQYARVIPNKVRYLQHDQHQNRGASASRNLGIRHARGHYIAFLDGDDVYYPETLDVLVRVLETRSDASIVYGNTLYWHSWAGIAANIRQDYVQTTRLKPTTLLKPPQLLTLFLQGRASVPCTCSILVRRDVIEHSGVFEESFRHIYTDQVFYAKICLQAAVVVSDHCCAKYRQHARSSVAVVKQSGRSVEARRTFLAWLAQYATDKGVVDRGLWRAIQIELWRTDHPMIDRLADHIARLSRRVRRRLSLLS